MTTRMKPIRSFLVVPGDRAGDIDRSAAGGADALVLDLADSVAPARRLQAREIVRSKLEELAGQAQRTWVRINRSPHLYDFDDLLAVVGPHVEGVVVATPVGPEDVDVVSAMLSEAEYRKGTAIGATRVLPLLQTSRALQFAHEIALRERVTAIAGATESDADDIDGRETLFIKARVVMAARAAGKLPIGGLRQQAHDLEDLKSVAQRDRALGMSGELVRHPSHVSTLNDVYGLWPKD